MINNQATEMGANRTGIGTSPIDSARTIEGAAQGEPVPQGDASALDELRAEYVREAPSMGSMPPPATVSGVGNAVRSAVLGTRQTVLLDRIGERLAFERTGTRLYEAVIAKVEASTGDAAIEVGAGAAKALPIERLRAIHDEELAHFELLRDAITRLGGDPTAQTPSANVQAVASMGLLQVASDPRSTPLQCLCALLTAELVDHDGWELLIELADAMGEPDLARSFRTALAQEETHLRDVRAWLAEGVFADAGVSLTVAV